MGWLVRVPRRAPVLLGALLFAGLAFYTNASKSAIPASAMPLAPETLVHLERKAINTDAPIYIRVFKEESELEVWKQRADGHYLHVKTYPVCNWSGTLGPKQRFADFMSPEGFYSVGQSQLKPDSAYHLAFNVGYPNELDRALGRTGDKIMVHGKCQSVGCFAMTDTLIEEIYAFVRDALRGGQASVPVHAFPFRMTAENMARHANHKAAATWAPLETAYMDFESSREVPVTAVCEKTYIVNPLWQDGEPVGLSAAKQCPAHAHVTAIPVSREVQAELTQDPLRAEGIKTRSAQSIAGWNDAIAKAALADIQRRDANRKLRRSAEAARQSETGGLKPLLGAH